MGLIKVPVTYTRYKDGRKEYEYIEVSEEKFGDALVKLLMPSYEMYRQKKEEEKCT